MTEIFEGLTVVGDPVAEEDCVVHLLASSLESYNILVTALEANVVVMKIEVVIERLMHEELKLKDRAGAGTSSQKAMVVKPSPKRKGPKFHYCKNLAISDENVMNRPMLKRNLT